MIKYLKSERGMALATVLVVSTALAIVGSSYLDSTVHEAGLVTQQVQVSQDIYCAEAGIGYAKNQLKTFSNWTDTEGWVGSKNSGSAEQFTVSFNYDTGTNIGEITSTCANQEIVLNVSRITPPPYNDSVCGCNEVTLSNNTVTNSYDSSDGAYGSTTTTQSGDVSSNGSVDIKKAIINGSVLAMTGLAAHQNCSISGDASVTNASYLDSDLDDNPGGNVGGSIIIDADLSPPCDCNAIDVATLASESSASNNNTSDANVNPYVSGDPATIFYMPNNANVTFSGGTYYFTSFSMSNNATINIAEGAQVIIVVNGPMTISNGASINTSDNVANVNIYSNSSADIYFGQNSSLSGTIYAPLAEVEVDNNAHIYGAILAYEVEMINNAGLHYDNNIANGSEPVDTTSGVSVQVNSWSQSPN